MELLSDIIKAVVPIAATAVCTFIVWALQQMRLEKSKAESAARAAEQSASVGVTALTEGMVILLRQHLFTIHQEATSAGKMTYTQRANFQDVYSAYTALGGNGVATQLSEEVSRIPIKEK